MTREEWDKIERQVANGRVVEFYDVYRFEFLLLWRWGRRFLLQDETGYTIKRTDNLKDMGIYLTAKRRY